MPHRKCGKLIVATNAAELDKIEAIATQGGINGVEGLELIGGNAARAHGAGACLHRRAAFAGDRHHRQPRYMLALRGDLEDAGGAIAFNTPVIGRRRAKAGNGRSRSAAAMAANSPSTRWSIARGLARKASRAPCRDYPATRVPRLVLAKGNYFTFAGKPAFSRLIYPTPIVGGLGVHVTLDLAGRMRFGPDVEWIERENYDVDPKRAALFYERIRTYWPGAAGRHACRRTIPASGRS